MNKLIVEYDPDNGIALPDNKSEEFVNDVIDNRSTISHIVVGTELLMLLFRCAIVKGRIKHTEIEFLFKGDAIRIDKFGTCERWPEGFGDIPMKALETLAFCDKKLIRPKKEGPLFI